MANTDTPKEPGVWPSAVLHFKVELNPSVVMVFCEMSVMDPATDQPGVTTLRRGVVPNTTAFHTLSNEVRQKRSSGQTVRVWLLREKGGTSTNWEYHRVTITHLDYTDDGGTEVAVGELKFTFESVATTSPEDLTPHF